MTQPLEIERKFLVPNPPGAAVLGPGRAIRQGYLAVEEDGTEVRVRRRGDDHFLTVKSGGHLERTEHEIPLDRVQFEVLWPASAARRVEKTRYRLEAAGHGIELDVYHGALEGLVVAEVEFPTREAAAAFVPPDWFGAEITYDERYKNRNLARLAEFKPFLGQG